MIKNGVVRRIEFGDFDNWGDLVPEAISLRVDRYSKTIGTCITYNYGPNDNRKIDLCGDHVDEIDFESFNTTFEEELAKVGFTKDEVQFNGGKLHIIKMDDGSIVPIEKFKVTFEYRNGNAEEVVCYGQGVDGAINCAKHRRWHYYDTIVNAYAEKVAE